MTKQFQKGIISVSGSWDLKTIANILRQHKDGSLTTSDAVWEFMKQMK